MTSKRKCKRDKRHDITGRVTGAGRSEGPLNRPYRTPCGKEAAPVLVPEPTNVNWQFLEKRRNPSIKICKLREF